MYWSRSSTSSAARSAVREDRARHHRQRQAHHDERAGRRQHPDRHPPHMVAVDELDVLGFVEQRRRRRAGEVTLRARLPRARQNALVHTRATTYSVSRLVTHAAADQHPGQRGTVLRAGLQQRHLADEAGKRRNATEIECGHHEHERQQRAGGRQPTQPLQGRRTRLAFDQADHQEQGRLHHDVVRHVVDRTGHAELDSTARCRTPCSRCG